MNINIEIGSPNCNKRAQTKIKHFLIEKFGEYSFIYQIEFKCIHQKSGENKVSLLIRTKKGRSNYAHSIHKDIYQATVEATKKLRVPIEKYKEKHYQKPQNTGV